MIEAGQYYKPNPVEFKKYMASALWKQTGKILHQMIQRGDGHLYVVSKRGNNTVEVAGNPNDALLGTVMIPTECLIDRPDTTMIQREEFNINRVKLSDSKIDAIIRKTILESEFGGGFAAKVDSDFDIENSIKTTAIGDFTSTINDLESAFANLNMKMEKCAMLGIQGIGRESYPFDESIPEIYKKVIHWNAAQLISQAKITGETP